jgi:hypothetical protein
VQPTTYSYIYNTVGYTLSIFFFFFIVEKDIHDKLCKSIFFCVEKKIQLDYTFTQFFFNMNFKAAYTAVRKKM